MLRLWGMQVGALLLSGSAAPTHRAAPTIIDLDHRGRASLLRTDQRVQQPLDVDGPLHTPANPKEYPNELADVASTAATSVSRYRRGPWGTLQCDTGSLPVANKLQCIDAAGALGGTYNPGNPATNSSLNKSIPEGCVMEHASQMVIWNYPHSDEEDGAGRDEGALPDDEVENANADFSNWAELCDTGVETLCPVGYTKELGDSLPEYGDPLLGSYKGGIYAETVDICAQKCSLDSRCWSFKWSPTETWGQDDELVCVLNSIQHADVQHTWKDFVFCSKDHASGTDPTDSVTGGNR